jgi:hypothetical protein
VSNCSVDRSEKRSRPFGLRLSILFIVLSAAVGLFVSIASLWEPFAVPFHLMGEPDFTAPNGLVKYVLRLVFILLFNLPLLYGGITTAFDLGNVTTSIALTFVSVLFGIAGWGLYALKNWARLFTLLISAFGFLPILGNFPPFFFHSYVATTALLPFVVPYGLLVFYLRREGVRQLFA